MKPSPKYRRMFDPSGEWQTNWSRSDAAKVLWKLRSRRSVGKYDKGVYKFIVGFEACTLVTVAGV